MFYVSEKKKSKHFNTLYVGIQTNTTNMIDVRIIPKLTLLQHITTLIYYIYYIRICIINTIF